jgi:hypothetical protein
MTGGAASSSLPEPIDVSVVMPVRNGMPHLAEQFAALARSFGLLPHALTGHCDVRRGDLGSMLRQWRKYGRGRARPGARYQGPGLPPTETWRDALATAGGLALHSIDCLRGQAPRLLSPGAGAHGRAGPGQPGSRGPAHPPRGLTAVRGTQRRGRDSDPWCRTRPRPAGPGHFLPNASARMVILVTARSGGAGQPAPSLVSGNVSSWTVFTDSFALDMNRVR